TGREQVSKYDVFMPGYTLPSQYHDACISVMRHASWIVIDRHATNHDVLKQAFPALQDAKPRETARFEHALDGAFELAARDGRFEVRRRRESTNETICSTIVE